MVFDMRDAKKEIKPHFKGGEKEMIATIWEDDKIKVVHGRLEPGATTGFHKHEGDCEILYVLQGKGKYLYDDGVEYAVEGQCQYCPEGHWHSMINEGPEDLVFYAVIPKKV